MRPLPSFARDLIALVVVALACPVAVFGGASLGCIGSATFSDSCAATVIFVSPLVLILSGAIAGISSRGWTGLLISLIGMFTGMTTILLLSQVEGKPVPLDIFSAVFATVFFGTPIISGYAIGRVLTRLFARRAA